MTAQKWDSFSVTLIYGTPPGWMWSDIIHHSQWWLYHKDKMYFHWWKIDVLFADVDVQCPYPRGLFRFPIELITGINKPVLLPFINFIMIWNLVTHGYDYRRFCCGYCELKRNSLFLHFLTGVCVSRRDIITSNKGYVVYICQDMINDNFISLRHCPQAVV